MIGINDFVFQYLLAINWRSFHPLALCWELACNVVCFSLTTYSIWFGDEIKWKEVVIYISYSNKSYSQGHNWTEQEYFLEPTGIDMLPLVFPLLVFSRFPFMCISKKIVFDSYLSSCLLLSFKIKTINKCTTKRLQTMRHY